MSFNEDRSLTRIEIQRKDSSSSTNSRSIEVSTPLIIPMTHLKDVTALRAGDVLVVKCPVGRYFDDLSSKEEFVGDVWMWMEVNGTEGPKTRATIKNALRDQNGSLLGGSKVPKYLQACGMSYISGGGAAFDPVSLSAVIVSREQRDALMKSVSP